MLHMALLGRVHPPILCALAVGVALGALPSATHAADAEASAPGTGTVRQEWVGVELTPASVSLASCCDRSGSLQRFQVGLGGNLRLFRHRWEHVYFTPLQAGLYVSSGVDTIFTHVQMEGGVIVPGTHRRLELGLGTGIGVLAMKYASTCDGSCNVGGAGWLISFAARYLFLDGPRFTAGAGVRALIPTTAPSGEVWGHFTGRGSMLLAALELGFGRS